MADTTLYIEESSYLDVRDMHVYATGAIDSSSLGCPGWLSKGMAHQ